MVLDETLVGLVKLAWLPRPSGRLWREDTPGRPSRCPVMSRAWGHGPRAPDVLDWFRREELPGRRAVGFGTVHGRSGRFGSAKLLLLSGKRKDETECNGKP